MVIGINMLKQILVLMVVMLLVGFGYYNFYDVLAQAVLKIGVIPSVALMALGLFVFASVLGRLLGAKKVTKITGSSSATLNNKKLDPKMMVMGLLVGLLVMLPMIVVFVWLYLNIG